jgi:hypothetical protein
MKAAVKALRAAVPEVLAGTTRTLSPHGAAITMRRK